MSERLDRIEALQEQSQLQIDVLVEQAILMQQEMRMGFQEVRETFQQMQTVMMQTQQQVDSLAKSVQAHCDDAQRYQ